MSESNSQSKAFLAGLSPADVDAIGERLDAIQQEAKNQLGQADRRYILNVIKAQRWLSAGGRALIFLSLAALPQWGHAFAGWGFFWPIIILGTLALATSKILENMEIGHNVLHGQWDWMQDPQINSRDWEWDHFCPADQWKHSHNVEHHTYTNVLGLDRDVGYGMLRVTQHQRWHPFYALQPLNVLMMALFFDGFIALHDLNIARLIKGKLDNTESKRKAKAIAAKYGRQMLKDYVAWPLLAGPFFLIVAAANLVANMLRNVWTFVVIVCGHFPDGVEHFSKAQIENETRGRWYLRQMLGSCNIRGSKFLHILTGNLSHQIEHHLFPDLASNRYAQVAPKVEALCKEYGLPYNSHRFSRQLGSTLWKLTKFTLPSQSQIRKPGSFSVHNA